MIVTQLKNPTVVVELTNGSYAFEDMSATGKTRLSKSLKQCFALGLPIISVTYDDILMGLTHGYYSIDIMT